MSRLSQGDRCSDACLAILDEVLPHHHIEADPGEGHGGAGQGQGLLAGQIETLGVNASNPSLSAFDTFSP